MKRHKDAHEIWNNGASNPSGVARALVQAIDEARTDGTMPNDPAVQMILDHLCFLCGLPQPSFEVPPPEWLKILNEVEEKSK